MTSNVLPSLRRATPRGGTSSVVAPFTSFVPKSTSLAARPDQAEKATQSATSSRMFIGSKEEGKTDSFALSTACQPPWTTLHSACRAAPPPPWPTTRTRRRPGCLSQIAVGRRGRTSSSSSCADEGSGCTAHRQTERVKRKRISSLETQGAEWTRGDAPQSQTR